MSGLRLPDFIIAGAPRCGTTWLWRLLDRHPGIGLAKPVRPEPKFFLVDELYAKGLAWYSATWFAGIPPEKRAGEKSTNYMESRIAAERIARDLPAVRLVFLLRNPIDRAYSNYLWSRSNGLESEDFATALALESEREAKIPVKLRFARPHDYFGRGCYHRHLTEYFSRLPRGQILVLRYEDLVEQTAPALSRLHRFLGVAERPDDAALPDSTSDGERNGSRPAIAEALRQDLARRYAEPNRRLGELLGPEFRLWPGIEAVSSEGPP